MRTRSIKPALLILTAFGLALASLSTNGLYLIGAARAADDRVVQAIPNPSCGEFYERQKFIGIDNSAINLMGSSVAIDGDTAVVGLPGDDLGEDVNAGSVLVYKRVAPNYWMLQAQLVAPTPGCGNNEGDQFGYAVAVSGNRIIVGAPYDDMYPGVVTGGACPDTENSGTVYVFESDGTTWTHTNTWRGMHEGDLFGRSVALDGDRAVIGLPGADGYDETDVGAICIKEKNPNGYNGWSDYRYWPGDATAGDWFGWSVAIRGGTVVAGAPLDDLGTLTDLGTVYIYRRHVPNGSWSLQEQLIPLDGKAHDQLGISVAISPDEQFIVAGAHYDRVTFTNQGSAYVYRFNGSIYTYQTKLTAADATIGDQFGRHVATNGREIVIGAPGANGSPDRGAAYVFKHNGLAWAQTNKLTAGDGADYDYFGGAVAISGQSVLIGATGDDYSGLADAGSAYLFVCGACPTVAVNPASIPPSGRVGALYDRTFTADGGTGPYTFSVSQGTLPPGLTLAANGKLSGVLTTEGTFNFTVRATASNGCSGRRDYSITVSGTCPNIIVNPTNPTLPTGFVNLPYSATFTATGGVAPHSFSLVGGALPPGLSLSAGGALSGNPATTGTYNFVVRAVAANNCVGSSAYTIVIQRLMSDPSLRAERNETGGSPTDQNPSFLPAIDVAWGATGALSTARSLHTATLLANGKVLVVGGINVINPCCTNTAVAELYDPATGQWSATGTPSTPRSNHIAVRLHNGKVLIASGNGDPFSNILDSAEIYDPNTGTWSPAGKLGVARQSPRATLLADGRVLVSGGLVVNGNQASFTNTAEVYDPATNAWTPTGTMNSGRVLHSVTLLSDGKVLAAGGSAASFNVILQRTAEIYDPATNAWTLTGELTIPRMTHTAIRLANGKVLVTGGGNASGNVINNAELYDPASGQWAPTGNMVSPRVLHTLTLLPNGKILAAGGASANTGGLTRSSELYDPATGNWSASAEMGAARLNHTAILLANGKVLVAAGGGAGQLTSAELYESGIGGATSVSAASFALGALAPESIAAAFGVNLAAGAQEALGQPLPTTLADRSVRVRDSLGVERLAPLFIVTPQQINYQIPAETAPGQALVTITSGETIVAAGTVAIERTAPGLFAANADGGGVAAALVFRIKAGGAQFYEPAAVYDSALQRFVAVPIDLGPETDQVFLLLYGTGIRFRNSLQSVTATVGGMPNEVVAAEGVRDYAGLDQVNVRLSRSLAGRGEVEVALTVDGRSANVVRVNIR